MRTRDRQAHRSPNSEREKSLATNKLPFAQQDTQAGLGLNVLSANNVGTLKEIIGDPEYTVDEAARNGYPNFREEDLLSWLQCPPDDLFEKGNADYANSQVVKHPYASAFSGCMPTSASLRVEMVPCGRGPGTGVDAVMAAGGGASSFHSGVGDLPKIRATTQPFLSITSSNALSTSVNLEGLDFSQTLASGCSSKQVDSLMSHATMPHTTFKSMDRIDIFAPHPTNNFLHFSRPVAKVKACLQLIGAGSGLTDLERVRQHLCKVGTQDVSSVSQITQIQVDEPSHEQRRIVSALDESGMPERDIGEGIHTDGGGDFSSNTKRNAEKGKNIKVFKCSLLNSPMTASEKGVHMLDIVGQSTSSASQCSASSSKKSGKEALKRKSSGGNELECESENVEETAANSRKSQATAKRTRTAEMHNQSERRRRDKIKEKMRTLRELIPNSNKFETDRQGFYS